MPGSPFLAGDYHFYNVIVTAHAFLMIFLCAIGAFNSVLHKQIAWREWAINQLAYLWGKTNTGNKSMPEKPNWRRAETSEKGRWDRRSTVRLCLSNSSLCTDHIAGSHNRKRTTHDTVEVRRSRNTDTLSWYERIFAIFMTKENLRNEKPRLNVTMGLPNCREVSGNRGFVVAGVRGYHTTRVMLSEKKRENEGKES